MAKKKKVDPKADPKLRTEGTPAEIKRNKKGDLVAKLGKDFGGVTQKSMRADSKVRAKTGDRTFDGAPARRTGGTQKVIAKSPGTLKSASKKVIRQSQRKPTGSPQARKSQKRNRY